jgi:glutamate dehydrogenase (NAD(P)+)
MRCSILVLWGTGGIIVSYFEMVQNLNMDHWEHIVLSRLKMHMMDTYSNVNTMAKNNNISLRRAAYSLAMDHVVEAMKMRGWV